MSIDIVTIGEGDVRVELIPSIGGRIHRITAFGTDVLRTPADPAVHMREPLFWGSYPMVPWCNRVPGGVLVFDGRRVQLPRNFGDFAIHGDAFAAPWSWEAPGTLRFEGAGDTGFPWRYHAEQVVECDRSTVRLTLRVTNRDEQRMPAGLGIHPWFADAAAARVAVPATLAYRCDPDALPIGEPSPVGPGNDLRCEQPVPLDTDRLWTGLVANSYRIVWPSSGVEVAYSFSTTATHAVVAAFADLDAFVVEAVTHATDGHARRVRGESGAIASLAPGESLEVAYALEFAPYAARSTSEDGSRSSWNRVSSIAGDPRQ